MLSTTTRYKYFYSDISTYCRLKLLFRGLPLQHQAVLSGIDQFAACIVQVVEGEAVLLGDGGHQRRCERAACCRLVQGLNRLINLPWGAVPIVQRPDRSIDIGAPPGEPVRGLIGSQHVQPVDDPIPCKVDPAVASPAADYAYRRATNIGGYPQRGFVHIGVGPLGPDRDNERP